MINKGSRENVLFNIIRFRRTMKKIFIILSALLFAAGCGTDSTVEINYNLELAERNNSILVGNNHLSMTDSSLLTTIFSYIPVTPTDNYNDTRLFSVKGNKKAELPAPEVVPQPLPEILPEDNISLKNNIDIFSLNNENNERMHLYSGSRKNIDDLNYQISLAAEKSNLNPKINLKNGVLGKSVPKDIAVGTVWNNVYVVNNGYTSTINARCIAVSDHAYYFLQDTLSDIPSEQLSEVTTAFDKDYNIIHSKFGTESDYDNNGKVIFLIADIEEGVMGFFYTADKYPNGTFSGVYSNEADILYVNYKYFAHDLWDKYKEDVKATFIHELQHMTFFDTRMRNGLSSAIPRWINEGLSMLAEYYGGYTEPHYDYISSYFRNRQNVSLITNDSTVDYGLSLLFMRYMRSQVGDDFVKQLYTSKNLGVRAIENITKMNFNRFYANFLTMIITTGRGLTTDTRYNVVEFNRLEGTDEYKKCGFNLSVLIDEVFSEKIFDNYFYTSKGFDDYKLYPYSIALTRWDGTFSSLDLVSDYDDVIGFYSLSRKLSY